MISRLTGNLFKPERYHFHPVMDSTNREARDLAHAGGPEGTVVVADRQTHGRGRYGRVWVSPAGLNLYFSMVLRPDMAASQASQLTLLAGLALVETLVVGAGIDAAQVKWPNDIMVHGRKLAGILSEMTPDGERVRFVTIGVGVDVNGSGADYPPEVAERVITMAEILQKNLDRGVLLADFLLVFESWYRRYLQEGFTPVRRGWLSHASLSRQRVRSGEMVGEALDMDEEGCLLVRREDGVVSRVMSGDVVLDRN